MSTRVMFASQRRAPTMAMYASRKWTELGHFVVLDGAGNGLVGGRELEAFLHRRVEVTRARALKVGPEFGDEVSCVEGLRQVEGACSAVAGNRSVEDPLELALVFGREPLRDVGDEASAQVGAAVDDEDVVDVDKCPQNRSALLIGVETDVDG